MKKTGLALGKYYLFSLGAHVAVMFLAVYLGGETKPYISTSTIEFSYLESQPAKEKSVVVKKKKPRQTTIKEIKPKKVKKKKLKPKKKELAINTKDAKAEEKPVSIESPSKRPDSLDSSPKSSTLILARPDYDYNPSPEYPRLARWRGFEGTVLLNVFVLDSGKVGRLYVKQTSGHLVLDQAAADSVREWRFVPGKRGGVPISSWVQIPIQFRLTK